MTDHGYFEELIMAAVDGEITPEEEAELRAHTDNCEQCRAFWEAMKAVSGVTARDLPPAPEGFAAGVMDAVRAQAPRKKKGRILNLPLRSISLAAIAALVLWAGFRIAPAFGAKGTSAAAPAQSMMVTAAGDSRDYGVSADMAEAEEEAPAEPTYEKNDSLMEAKPQESLALNTPAEAAMEAAPQAPEPLPEMTWKIYAGEDLQAEPLLSGSDGTMEKILTAETPCAVPARAADYTVTVNRREEQVWLLWIEEGGLVVRNTAEDAAGISAGPELLEELLQSAGIK